MSAGQQQGDSQRVFIPIGEIQEFLFDSRDPSRNMEPIQTMLL